jgi:hypothetical protein
MWGFLAQLTRKLELLVTDAHSDPVCSFQGQADYSSLIKMLIESFKAADEAISMKEIIEYCLDCFK